MLPTFTPCNGRPSPPPPPPPRRNNRRPARAQPAVAADTEIINSPVAGGGTRRGPPPNVSSSARPRARAAQTAPEPVPLAKRRKPRQGRGRVAENNEVASSSNTRGGSDARLDKMPAEILEKIFTNLSRGDLAAVSSQGRRFHDVGNSLLYRNLTGTFERNDALILLLTLIKRPNFAAHARVFDGYKIGMSISRAELNLIAAAICNMPWLRVLSLPPFVEERHLIQTHPNLRVLHISGPAIPAHFLARHPRLRALEFVLQDLNRVADMEYMGPGTPLRFVRCCALSAVGLLPPADHIRPTARRVLGVNCVLQVFPSNLAEPYCSQDARTFLNALRVTRTPPGTLVLDRQFLRHVGYEIVVIRITRIRHIHYIRACIHTSNKEKRNEDMEYIKALLLAFADLATLELYDDTPHQPPENWFNEALCTNWRKMRPSLKLVISPKKSALEHQASGWVPVQPPPFPENPFVAAGLGA